MSVKFKVPIEVDGKVSAEYLDLSTTTTRVVDAGEIAWNSIDGTFDIGLLNGVTLQAGQEMHFYGKATEAISNGNAVMFAGVQGDHILIAKADAATINANPEYFMGVATQDFTTNQFGYVTSFGNVRGLNTLSYTLGDVLYFDSTSATDGLLTATEPSAPNAKIIVAAVVRVHATQGILAVRPHTMPKLKDIQDVNVDTATTGEILQLQSTGVWENKTLSEAGIISGSGTTNYLSKFTGSTTLGNSLLFDNGTNVGIGTTVPQSKLEVRSSGAGNDGAVITLNRIGAWASAYSGLKLNTNDDGTDWWNVGMLATGNNTFNIGQNGGAMMSILVNGNVGIGTTSPTQKLEVFGNIKLADGGQWNIIGALNQSLGIYASPNNLSEGIIFSTDNGTTAEMFIQDGGNVGIGTTNPTRKLEVIGDIFSNFVGINSNVTGLGGDIFTCNDSDLNNLFDVFGNINSENYNVGIGDWQEAAGYPSLTINRFYSIFKNGNVGIGTSSPSTNLEVVGTLSSVTPSIRIKQDLGLSSMAMDLVCDLFSNAGIIDVGTSNNTIFRRGSSESMRIANDGYIGINTSSPNARVHVRETIQGQRAMTIQINEDPLFGAGLMNFENNAGSNVGSISYNGSSTSYNTSSDYRLKENVVKMDRALERLKLLKPVNFNFINKPGTVVDGFIAHEVQEVIPEAIVGVKDELDKYGKPKYQGIDHSKIVPLLTAALQEAIDKISQLEERIQKLENNPINK